MTTSPWSYLTGYVQRAERWYLTTPDRALDRAYDAALTIQSTENEHFRGQKITLQNGNNLGEASFAYFEQELNRHLKELRLRLTEFRSSRSTVTFTNPKAASLRSTNPKISPNSLRSADDRTAVQLEKLRFIDQVLVRYQSDRELFLSQAMVTVPPKKNAKASTAVAPSFSSSSAVEGNRDREFEVATRQAPPNALGKIETMTDSAGILPRSILSTINRLRRDLDPDGATDAVQDFEARRMRSKIAVRFILTLIAVPILVQLSVRNFVLTDRLLPGQAIQRQFAIVNPAKIFLNGEMTESALKALAQYEERLKFENILKSAIGQEVLSHEVQEEKVRAKVNILAKEYSQRSASAIKNWIADLSGVVAFSIIFINGKREMKVVTGFMDELTYGLSDSAKAFIIILFTDIFVGFHSPHGWEVLLEGIADHLGIASNRSYVSLFIATFPVILDTIFKYWIFRHLNRISPSAVATYKEMNE
jgi:CemA family